MPERIQLSRRRGWRKPEGAIVVSRPSRWGNPFAVGETQLRFPRVDGTEAWEHEGRLHKRSGSREAFHHGDFTLRPDGSKLYRVTFHDIRDATVEEVVAMYRQHITGEGELLEKGRWHSAPTGTEIREQLAGHDLACWCPIQDADGNRFPCHADVLLELANAEGEA